VRQCLMLGCVETSLALAGGVVIDRPYYALCG